MFNVVVEIKAPEIVEAIRSLACALVGAGSIQTPAVTPVVPQVQEQPQIQQQIQPQQALPQQMQEQPQYPTLGYASQQQAPVQTQQAPIQQPVQQTQPTAVPTTAQTYSMDQLAVAATQLMDAGRRTELLNLLAAFGVQALTALPKEQYGNFATQLRTMGAKI